jgi:hypothetical protein
MAGKKKRRVKKLLRGLFRAPGEEMDVYFDPAMSEPDEYSLVRYLANQYGHTPMDEETAEEVLFDSLRELSAEDDTDEMVEMRVKEFLEYGFVERWNSGQYWEV